VPRHAHHVLVATVMIMAMVNIMEWAAADAATDLFF
jgi:hypothetical protein